MSTSDFPIIINGSMNIDSTGNSKYRFRFPAAVEFKRSKCAVASVSLFYSWFNISAANNNNRFSYVFPTAAGSTTVEVVVQDGFYSIFDLNSYLQRNFILNGFYTINITGNFVYYLELTTNATFYAIQVNSFPVPTILPADSTNPASMTFPAVASTPRLIVPENLFRDIIGFNAGSYPPAFQSSIYSKLSSYTPQVSVVKSIILACSLLQNKYSNPPTILYSFTPAGLSFGSLIESKPSEFSFVDIANGLYTEFDIQFLDQNFKPIAINDSNITVQLLLKMED